MILDHISNAERYYSLHPGLREAFEWLRANASKRMPAGRIHVEGSSLYVDVSTADGRGHAGAAYEAHRRRIDIQYVIAGTDEMSWRRLDGSLRSKGYNTERDFEAFEEVPECWITVPEGHFTIFFPEDVHAAMGGSGPMYKYIAKVAV